MERPRYKEENTLRAYLKKEALLKGKRKRNKKTDPRIAPYMYFFHCLGDQETTISKILEIIADAENKKAAAAAAYNAKPKLSAALDEIADEMRLEQEAISHEEVQDIFAGTLFVLLNSLLWSMSSRVKNRGGSPNPRFAGRTIGKTCLFELMRAASNNFRHYEEWNVPQKSNRQMACNVAILKAAGLKRPWNRNLCGEVLETIGWKTTDELTREVRKLASEIFQAQTGIPL